MSTKVMQQTIADYFKTQPVLKAWIFGSFARGEESPLSDVDILVQFDEGGVSLLKHAAMICELEQILGRPVDIVPEKMLRPRVRENVDQDKKLIYESAAHKSLVQTAERMKLRGYDTEEIYKITGLGRDEIEAL